MSKRTKIVLSKNDSNIRKRKGEVTNYLILLERAKKALNELTEGNVEDLSIEAVDSYLNSKSGFLNGLMSATAYNLENQYSALKTLLIDLNEGGDSLEFISKGKVDDAKIEQANTTYLNKEYVGEFLRLQEAVDILNESNITVVNNCLNLKGDKVRLNASVFNVSKQLLGR